MKSGIVNSFIRKLFEHAGSSSAIDQLYEKNKIMCPNHLHVHQYVQKPTLFHPLQVSYSFLQVIMMMLFFLIPSPPGAAQPLLVHRLTQLYRAPPRPAHPPKNFRRETELEMMMRRNSLYCKTCASN